MNDSAQGNHWRAVCVTKAGCDHAWPAVSSGVIVPIPIWLKREDTCGGR